MMVTAVKLSELQRNYSAFMRILPDLLPAHEGEFALMRDGQIVKYFDNPRDALLSGRKQFSDDLFSVQEVRTAKVDFGWHSRAPINERL